MPQVAYPASSAKDTGEFIIAMQAAPSGAEMWNTWLFRGEMEPEIARSAGETLGSIVAASWNNAEAEKLFGDQTVFAQLRIDPYYRYAARCRPEASGYISRLIGRSAARRVRSGPWRLESEEPSGSRTSGVVH